MALYEFTTNSIVKIEETNLVSQGIKERQDLQRILRTQISRILPDTYVLAEEFGEWEDARRSIDLLCIDSEANLVVVELKRTEDGGHMDLQAIRYAAMVSRMTFADAVAAHAKFLAKLGEQREAESEILKFLGWEEPQPSDFAQEVRIVLMSNNFNKEITTAAMWLREYEIEVECIRLHSYKLADRTFLDVQKIVPLPEAATYQVQLRRKAAEVREAKAGTADWSRYDLVIGDETLKRLYKRQLFHHCVRALVNQGVSVSQIQKFIPQGKFIAMPEITDGTEFRAALPSLRTVTGAVPDPRRYYLQDDELFTSEGKTWALSNQWALNDLPTLDELLANFPKSRIRYSKIDEASEM
jgi:hypothetical protein